MRACHSLLISPVNHVHHLSTAKCTAIVAPRITLLSTAQVIETTERIESITSDAIVDNDQLAQELGSAFAQKLMELETYRRENGNCIVPKRYEQNQPLGNWVNKQRQNYRKFLNGENSSMIQVSHFAIIFPAFTNNEFVNFFVCHNLNCI